MSQGTIVLNSSNSMGGIQWAGSSVTSGGSTLQILDYDGDNSMDVFVGDQSALTVRLADFEHAYHLDSMLGSELVQDVQMGQEFSFQLSGDLEGAQVVDHFESLELLGVPSVDVGQVQVTGASEAVDQEPDE
jgi:hypothetical protein